MRLHLLIGAFAAGVAVAGCGAKTGIDFDDALDGGRRVVPGPTSTSPAPTSTAPRPTPTTPTPTPVPSPTSPPLVCSDVTGRWAGTWTSASGLVGTWQTDMVEGPGGALSGKSVVTGTQCGTSSTVVGKRAGCAISFGLADFGSCTVDFDGTVSGDRMGGSFTVTAGLNDRGSWEGTRVR